MDDADRAIELEEARTAEALRQIALRNAQRNDVLICEDCDGPIPAARKVAVPNCTRCVRCEEENDKLYKGVKRL